MKTFDLLVVKRRDHKFSSGSYTGEDFKAFARDFKATAKTVLAGLGYELIMGKPGHYYLSGFIRSGEKYVYFSVPDVRYYPGSWADKVLVRTAKDAKDFSGGSNCFIPLAPFTTMVTRFLA